MHLVLKGILDLDVPCISVSNDKNWGITLDIRRKKNTQTLVSPLRWGEAHQLQRHAVFLLEAFWSCSQLCWVSIISRLLHFEEIATTLYLHCICLEIRLLSVWEIYPEHDLGGLVLWNFYAGYGSSTTHTMKRAISPRRMLARGTDSWT